MKQKDGAKALGPDGYSRFFVIIKLLEGLYKGSKKPVRILDIGGCSPYMHEVLTDSGLPFELTVMDILPKPAGLSAKYIQADATKNDLADGSFDVVISTDTLEHIPAAVKDDFVRACVRLSRDATIIAAPFATPGVHEAEVMVNDFNKQLFHVGQDWLEEHFEAGKPDVRHTAKLLDALKADYVHFGTNNLYSWLFSTHLNLIEAKLGTDAVAARRARQAYNQQLAASIEFDEPTYRHFFVVYKRKRPAGKNPLASIVTPSDPTIFAAYQHDLLATLAEYMTQLRHDALVAEETVAGLNQQLQNEQIHSYKLNEELLKAHAEIKRLEPLRRLARFRHPKQAAKAVKKKLSGKK